MSEQNSDKPTGVFKYTNKTGIEALKELIKKQRGVINSGKIACIPINPETEWHEMQSLSSVQNSYIPTKGIIKIIEPDSKNEVIQMFGRLNDMIINDIENSETWLKT